MMHVLGEGWGSPRLDGILSLYAGRERRQPETRPEHCQLRARGLLHDRLSECDIKFGIGRSTFLLYLVGYVMPPYGRLMNFRPTKKKIKWNCGGVADLISTVDSSHNAALEYYLPRHWGSL
ncbi:hypothetical protein BDV59DRAFT_74303 [Aspergillus ambiguus]|uniref:uncharacterized protein n=1 Tax=Aspergillus ambiguus TaxID=176160 RepID=UPI003CCE1B86